MQSTSTPAKWGPPWKIPGYHIVTDPLCLLFLSLLPGSGSSGLAGHQCEQRSESSEANTTKAMSKLEEF